MRTYIVRFVKMENGLSVMCNHHVEELQFLWFILGADGTPILYLANRHPI